MVDRFGRFSYAIAEISRCWHKIAADEMGRYGLKGVYAVYLVTLANHPEGMTAAKLAETTGKDKADVSRAVSVMLEKDIITRSDSGSKTYRAPLRLSQKGWDIASHVQKRAGLAVENGGRGLSEEGREQFYAALEQIIVNLQEACKEGLEENE